MFTHICNNTWILFWDRFCTVESQSRWQSRSSGENKHCTGACRILKMIDPHLLWVRVELPEKPYVEVLFFTVCSKQVMHKHTQGRSNHAAQEERRRPSVRCPHASNMYTVAGQYTRNIAVEDNATCRKALHQHDVWVLGHAEDKNARLTKPSYVKLRSFLKAKLIVPLIFRGWA